MFGAKLSAFVDFQLSIYHGMKHSFELYRHFLTTCMYIYAYYHWQSARKVLKIMGDSEDLSIKKIVLRRMLKF